MVESGIAIAEGVVLVLPAGFPQSEIPINDGKSPLLDSSTGLNSDNPLLNWEGIQFHVNLPDVLAFYVILILIPFAITLYWYCKYKFSS